MAQVDCPAMAISRPNVNHKRLVSGFGSLRQGGRGQGQMADFFATRTSRPRRQAEHTEFATRGSRAGFFRDFDEFARKRQGGGGAYRDMDEFSRKRSGQGRYRDFDEFTRKGNRQAESNRKNNAGKASRGFHRTARRVRSQDSRESRGRSNRSEYTPFASSRGPSGDEIRHREPQMGLWGGTIGKRGGKEKRKMVPFPESGEDEDKE